MRAVDPNLWYDEAAEGVAEFQRRKRLVLDLSLAFMDVDECHSGALDATGGLLLR